MGNAQASLNTKSRAEILWGLYQPIQDDLQRVEELLAAEVRTPEPYINDLIEHSSQFAGKRIRPALLLHTARLCGAVGENHVMMSVIVELLHNATLIHDDVLDESEKRRNVPTVHMKWGNDAAILFGDYLFSKAFALCARMGNPTALEILAGTTENTCLGEMIQVSTKFNMDITEPFYLRMIGLKTASLFSASCQLGALQPNISENGRHALGRYGYNLGMAFQIVDDCLDIVGDEQEAGKSLGTDLGKGKWTLPIIVLLRQLQPAQRQDLEHCLTSPASLQEKKNHIADLAHNHGVIEYTCQRAREFVEAAKAELKPLDGNGRLDYLHQIADFVIDRKS